MSAWPRRAATAALLVASLAGTAAASQPLAHLPVLGGVATARRAQLASALARALEGAGHDALDGARLSDDAAAAEHRRRADALVASGRALAEQVHYEAALRTLAAAEREARAGLALFVAPRLLAEICFYRGIALLPTDRAEGTRSLVQSFQLHPERTLVASERSPKLERAIARARAEARVAPPLRPSDEETSLAARALGVERLVLLRVSGAGGREEARLARFDLRQPRWREARAIGWSASADEAALVAVLRGAFDEILPAKRGVARPRPARSPGAPRRTLPLVLAGLGGAALASGAVLLVLARGRENAAQGLADQTPPVEYEPRVREIEEAGRRYDAAGIACLVAGGAAVVVATAVWLLRPEPSRPRLSVGPGGIRVALSWR